MRVLITGVSGDIGKAIALEFLKNDHEVIGFDIKEAIIPHRNYTHYVVDIRKEEDLIELDDINILINCAGVQNKDDIDTNLKALIRVSEKYALQDKIYSVLNIGSASGHTGSEFPEYAASKGGVIAYTKNLALRLARYNATCNSLDPGGVLTDLNACVIEDEALWSEIMKETPLKRWATPKEIAEWAYFLVVINRFCTGQSIIVDGGESINFNFVWK